MANSEALYKAVGRKIREVRERSGQKISQDKLAKRLGISRASIVNIEAGRQHAPLHVLWEIAETLGTDLVLLLPRQNELVPADLPQLSEEMLKQIELAINGDPVEQQRLTELIGKLSNSIASPVIQKETL